MKLSTCHWEQAGSHLKLEQNQIHIWKLDLIQQAGIIDKLAAYLAHDELCRARHYHFERDQRNFILGRGYLRHLLGFYLGMNPSEITFGYESQGKPYLLNNGVLPISFNISHTHEMAIFVFNLKHCLGVDIEYLRPLSNILYMAEQNFTAREFAYIRQKPPKMYNEVFFQLWTAKEAFLKTTGEGLAGLPNIEIDITSDSPSILRKTGNHKNQHIKLKQWIPKENFMATLAFDDHGQELHFFQDLVSLA